MRIEFVKELNLQPFQHYHIYITYSTNMKKLRLLIFMAGILLSCNKEKEDITTGIVTEEISLELKSIGGISCDLTAENKILFKIMKRGGNESLGSYFGYSYEGVNPDTLQVVVQGGNINFLLQHFTRDSARALNEGHIIDANNYWYNGDVVMDIHSGFRGKGEKYLGIKLINGTKSHYGWIKVSCSQYSDTIRVIEYGYNSTPGREIKAGQKNN